MAPCCCLLLGLAYLQKNCSFFYHINENQQVIEVLLDAINLSSLETHFSLNERKLSDNPSILYYTFLLSLVWGNKDRINLLISIILLTIQSFQTRYQDPPVSWYERCCGQSIMKLSNQFNLSKDIWCLPTNILTKKLRLDLVFSLLCEPGWKN